MSRTVSLLLLALLGVGTLACCVCAESTAEAAVTLAKTTQQRAAPLAGGRRALLGKKKSSSEEDDDSSNDDDDDDDGDDDDGDDDDGADNRSGGFRSCQPDYYHAYTVRQNYACKDTNYRIFRDVSRQTCEDECSCLPECSGFTYNPDREACYLKTECNRGEFHREDLSGFKEPRPHLNPGVPPYQPPSYPAFPPEPVSCNRNGLGFGLGNCICDGAQVGEAAGIAACSRLSAECSSFQSFSNDPFLESLQQVCDALAENSCKVSAQNAALGLSGCLQLLQAGNLQNGVGGGCSAQRARNFFASEVDRMCAPLNPSSSFGASNLGLRG